eukprot:scaffold139316_cov31-Tisochrysis_lutea.AAC.1
MTRIAHESNSAEPGQLAYARERQRRCQIGASRRGQPHSATFRTGGRLAPRMLTQTWQSERAVASM